MANAAVLVGRESGDQVINLRAAAAHAWNADACRSGLIER
jgi:hypothetical protein